MNLTKYVQVTFHSKIKERKLKCTIKIFFYCDITIYFKSDQLKAYTNIYIYCIYMELCMWDLCKKEVCRSSVLPLFLVGSTPSGRSSVWTFTSFSGWKVSVTGRGKLPLELSYLSWFGWSWFGSYPVHKVLKPFFTFTCYCTFMHLDGAFCTKSIQVILYIYQFMHPLSNWTHDLDIASKCYHLKNE